ncbi:aminopeptidase A. Metallo peptidase. MEROPS family M17 [Nitrosomonas ureae]|uniref:Probable cytosol aminopeptidase n=1 Tax=Nitrosomonas ureae TaxID=44577 RepID=A0A285BW56_9PROT|nr:leucyl aminopeptidase [Nitrosomonas ureae]SNX59531.1 aminopeptidase A. Metallo peptidase. MEROPS family M17 [Nitrosomonas ureae]
MDFGIKVGTPEKQRGACAVIGIFESRKMTESAKVLDKITQGYIKSILTSGDMDGKVNTSLLLHNVPGIHFKRILLIGLGKEQEFKEKTFLGAINSIFSTLQKTAVTDVMLFLSDFPIKERANEWKICQTVIAVISSVYQFNQLKSKPENNPGKLRKILLCIDNRSELIACEQAMQQGLAIAHGMNLTKDLGNLAPNICTPTYLATQAKNLAKTHKLKASILEEKDMEKLGMGSFLAVARGSEQPAKLIVLEYHGLSKKEDPIVLVGKGVTFDTGGISLKPAAEMDEMKFDMSGAGSVLGTMLAVAEMKLPVNLVGIIPATENMPSGKATKPGDVVTSMSGQTIEILNTDAEGRLILCDALTYAERYNPKMVIDIATLTGACVIALGNFTTGLMSNDDKLTQELLAAGELTADRAWQLPLWDDYQDLLKSNFADIANIGGRTAGTITAACFLSRFTKKYRWAHLDIAGTAWKSGKDKGSSGRPVPLLTQFLITQSKISK